MGAGVRPDSSNCRIAPTVSTAAATAVASAPQSCSAARAASVASFTDDMPRYPESSMRSVNCPTPTMTGVFGSRFIDPLSTAGRAPAKSGAPTAGRYRLCRISRASAAVSDGVLPTLTPAASRASFLAAAVPDEPDTMAPA